MLGPKISSRTFICNKMIYIFLLYLLMAYVTHDGNLYHLFTCIYAVYTLMQGIFLSILTGGLYGFVKINL